MILSIAEKVNLFITKWCPRLDSNQQAVMATDFKSVAYTNSATRAMMDRGAAEATPYPLLGSVTR